MWRPVHVLLMLLLVTVLADLALYFSMNGREMAQARHAETIDLLVAGLGLTDLCIATEARYTRHPAISDPVVPFMDYPGAVEHFPTGSFWAPVRVSVNRP